MRVQYGSRNGETQPDTPGLTRAGLFKPCKRIEDAGEIRIGYARSALSRKPPVSEWWVETVG